MITTFPIVLVLQDFRVWSTIIFIMSGDFLMFYQIVVLPKVKRCTILSYKHGLYELPHELPNKLRLRTLGN